MDQNEIEQLGEKLAQSFDTGQIKDIRDALKRIVSHLESEQGAMVRLSKIVTQHERILFGDRDNLIEQPGIVNHYAIMIKNQNRNQKLLAAVLTSSLTLVFIEGIKLLAKNVP